MRAESDAGLASLGLDIDRLRAALSPDASRAGATGDDGVVAGAEGLEGAGLTPASVLFPIVLRPHAPSVLLTQRNETLRDHPGQISFPGGRVEPQDRSPQDTALREAQEEIGLGARHVEVVGYLPDYRTVTGFCVTPVVALVTPPFDLRPDPREVAEVFEVPFSFLMDAANHQRRTLLYRGSPRQYIAMPYGDYFIWGATAAIIATLARALAR